MPEGVDAHMYKPEYEGLGRVMCYNQVVYQSGKQSATINAHCRQHDSIKTIQYNWNNEGFVSSSSYNVDSTQKEAISLIVKVTDSDGKDF